eukprot:CAMPEP_0114307910 /NCGR_PEP_ID=MMETSP0059-20121206/17747_1 /TAXON_ID=36894 /ORGANISM="Pyramimonas parkeae, Strain CCMP726" /LENGTH=471 /DNA_ID=CAMNT_0001431457 /DNA_START=79 /DNA_END=1490 /DNA_ORIENTATION=+
MRHISVLGDDWDDDIQWDDAPQPTRGGDVEPNSSTPNHSAVHASAPGHGWRHQLPTPNHKHVQTSRYFILKSLNHHNIASAIEHGVWATQRVNEAKLNDAFRSAEEVFLIFSVNTSQHFQGYARMLSPIRSRQQSGLWAGDMAVGGQFQIAWLRLFDLPFNQTLHLKNPLNDNKPVKISRDGQELPEALGRALVALLESGADAAGVPRPEPRQVEETEEYDSKQQEEQEPQRQQQQQQQQPHHHQHARSRTHHQYNQHRGQAHSHHRRPTHAAHPGGAHWDVGMAGDPRDGRAHLYHPHQQHWAPRGMYDPASSWADPYWADPYWAGQAAPHHPPHAWYYPRGHEMQQQWWGAAWQDDMTTSSAAVTAGPASVAARRSVHGGSQRDAAYLEWAAPPQWEQEGGREWGGAFPPDVDPRHESAHGGGRSESSLQDRARGHRLERSLSPARKTSRRDGATRKLSSKEKRAHKEA